MACVRALGIVDKTTTLPLWRLIEKSKNISSIQPHLIKLKRRLEDLSQDCSTSFLENKVDLFGEEIKNDDEQITADTAEKMSLL